MPSSLYKTFKTSEDKEVSGEWLDYGVCRIKIARAGGSNTRYNRAMERHMRANRKAQQFDMLSDDDAGEALRKVYADSIVLDWETKQDGAWVKGIEDAEGKIGPVTVDSIIVTFTALPDLFRDVIAMSQQIAVFRDDAIEADSKN